MMLLDTLAGACTTYVLLVYELGLGLLQIIYDGNGLFIA